MRYDRLFTKLYATPLCLNANAWRGFERALLALAAVPRADANVEAGKLSSESRKRRMDNILELAAPDTALIHIDGAIDKHISAMEMECYGGFDLRDLDAALDSVAADPAIRNAMLWFNTPGGSVTGVPESAARIAKLAKRKNVYAFTDGMCCSAGYWLASQCDQVFATASADVGSIGVYCALLDYSEQLAAEGVKVNFIKDGEYKGMGAPFKPLTDNEREMFQNEVANIGEMFRSAVTAKRPDVKDSTMQGQSFFGAAARKAKLVDAIVSDLGEALAQF